MWYFFVAFYTVSSLCMAIGACPVSVGLPCRLTTFNWSQDTIFKPVSVLYTKDLVVALALYLVVLDGK